MLYLTLLTNIRYNFKKSGFVGEGNEISWEHVERFYEIEKQPVGYFLTSGPMSSWSWKTVFLNVETNCKWLACWWWCDQGSNNRSMMTELGISVTDLTFEVNNEKLHALFDPPHKYQVQL